jgi:integrase/recombinase XerD
VARSGPRKRPSFVAGDASDPHGMGAHLAAFLEYLSVKGYSEETAAKSRIAINAFIRWCEERGIARTAEVTRPLLVRYQRHLYHYRTKVGRPLSFRSQHFALVRLRSFFRYLARNNLILYNPASDLELPRLDRRLPQYVLSASEAETVINQADTTTSLGIRDRAILETFYSTGIRRMELARLRLFDLDAERGTVMVRQGKGKKDRMIPIGERALGWIGKYIADVRPTLVVEPDEGTLFLSSYGELLSGSGLSLMVREYVEKANVGKKGSCHLFRHTMATLMLEGGADIRFIQAMLGHAELSTTQIYTQVSIRKLKEVHTATHPAKMTRGTKDLTAPDGEDDAPAAAVPNTAPETMGSPPTSSPATLTDGAHAVLFDALAVEVDEGGES